MVKIIELFKELKPWLNEIEEFSKYNNPVKGSDNQYHYIYCWINLDTQWCYVGAHNSNNAFNEENYLGSCHNLHYWNSRKLHPFKCIIIEYLSSPEIMLKRESEILTEDFLNKYKNNGIFNLTTGGNGNAYHLHQPEIYDKMKDDQGRLPINQPKVREKILNTMGARGNGDTMYQCHTPEVINRMASTLKENWKDPEYRSKMKDAQDKTRDKDGVLPMHSKEARQRSLETRIKNGNGDPAYGMHRPEVFQAMKDNNGGVLPFNTPESYAKSVETKRKLSSNGDPYESIHTPEVYNKITINRWINAFNRVIDSMLTESNVFTLDLYIKHKVVANYSAPAADANWLLELINKYNDRLNLSKFIEIKL